MMSDVNTGMMHVSRGSDAFTIAMFARTEPTAVEFVFVFDALPKNVDAAMVSAMLFESAELSVAIADWNAPVRVKFAMMSLGSATRSEGIPD